MLEGRPFPSIIKILWHEFRFEIIKVKNLHTEKGCKKVFLFAHSHICKGQLTV